jgi:hypothetical protein
MDSVTPRYLYLVPIGFGFNISFVHIRNFFIATDVLLQKKPLQCEQPCLLVARAGTRTPDDVVCYLGMEHSPGPSVDCWSCSSSPPRTTKFDRIIQNPICGEIFVLCRTGQEVDILYRYNMSVDGDTGIFATVHYLWLLGPHQPIEYLSNCLPIRH